MSIDDYLPHVFVSRWTQFLLSNMVYSRDESFLRATVFTGLSVRRFNRYHQLCNARSAQRSTSTWKLPTMHLHRKKFDALHLFRMYYVQMRRCYRHLAEQDPGKVFDRLIPDQGRGEGRVLLPSREAR